LQTPNSIPKFLSSPITKTLVYANVFIAICSLAQVFVTYLVFYIPFDFKNSSYLLFILLSTYLQYNVQRGYMLNPANQFTERSQWLAKHRKTLLISVGACLIVVLFLCNNLSYLSIGIMIGAELISTFYYLPPFNFRKYGYIKPILISAIWVISCGLVPLIENNLMTENAIWFLASQFCFIITLCILFDVKDAKEDFLNGINTYANAFGIKSIKSICVALMLAYFLCYLFFKHSTLSTLVMTGITSVITIGSILLTNEKKHTFYYYLWIDGLMIVQSLVFLCFIA
jgi:4-hydroxybenzoate polyprenyltransferase